MSLRKTCVNHTSILKSEEKEEKEDYWQKRRLEFSSRTSSVPTLGLTSELLWTFGRAGKAETNKGDHNYLWITKGNGNFRVKKTQITKATRANQHPVPTDVMMHQGHNITSGIFVPKMDDLNLIVRKRQTSTNVATLYHTTILNLQKCQGEKHTKRLSNRSRLKRHDNWTQWIILKGL